MYKGYSLSKSHHELVYQSMFVYRDDTDAFFPPT